MGSTNLNEAGYNSISVSGSVTPPTCDTSVISQGFVLDDEQLPTINKRKKIANGTSIQATFDDLLRNRNRIWIEECIFKYFIAKDINKKNIVVFDEGLAQRSSFLLHTGKSYKKDLKNYIVHKIKPDYLIFIDDNINKLLKKTELRRSSKLNSFIYKDEKHISIYKKFFKEYQNYLKKII